MANKGLAKDHKDLSILVTGGAGFIGSHTCVELIQRGYSVVIVDDLSNSSQIAVDRIRKICGIDADDAQLRFYKQNILDREALDAIFAENDVDAIIHFAGFKAVGESVQKPLERLAAMGYDVTVVDPGPDGTLDIDRMLDHVDKNTILVACMMVNNEVGTRNDVERLAAEVKRRNSRTIVHVDAVQAWMRVPIKLANIDTLAVSGHKIHAPKGIGALYLSDSLYQAFQAPYLGGEQEREKRPGTENLPYALGLAAAATRLNKTMKSRDAAVRALNLRLREGLKAFPEVVINSPDNAVPEVLNFSENCIKSETMLAHLAQQQVYVSSASACGRGQPSHTLAAMGRDPLAIDTAIRVSFCADNTPEDVDAFLNAFEDGMKHLQRIKK